MSANNSNGLGGILFFAILAGGIWLSDWTPFRSELSTYQITCAEFTPEGTCSAKGESPAAKITYRPDRGTKTVVYWLDGEAPMKFDNCAIVDAKNWSCPHGFGSHQMIDGLLDGRDESLGYPYQASKFKWWWLKFKNM
jgi:hypothetical protein